MMKAVVLLSGGVDSSTCMAIARHEGYELYAMSFDYGQRHSKELGAGKKIARYFGVKEHKILKIDLKQLGGSALTDENIDIPENRETEHMSDKIPMTYVPARNTIFLGFALAYAEIIDADAIYIGANALDYSGYPDCRPEYYKAFEEVARLGTKKGVEGRVVEIKYPLINMTKAEIIRTGIKLGVPYEFTWSCYKGGDKACGVCDSCRLRIKGFREAGYKDPIEYEVSINW